MANAFLLMGIFYFFIGIVYISAIAYRYLHKQQYIPDTNAPVEGSSQQTIEELHSFAERLKAEGWQITFSEDGRAFMGMR
jgi:hypothetical protein